MFDDKFDDEVARRRKLGITSAVTITILGALLLIGIFFYLSLSTI